MSSSDTASRSIRALGWSAVQGWSAQLFSLVVYVVLARLLAPADFGIAALGTLYFTLATAVVDQGMQSTLVQREELHDEHVNAAWWLNVAVAAALTGLTWFVAPALARAFDEPLLAEVLRWLCPAILVRSVGSVHSAVLQRTMDFRSLALRSALGIFVGGCAAVAVGLGGGGVWALVVYTSVSTLVQSAVLIARSPWRPRLGLSASRLGQLYGFGRYVLGAELLGFLNRQLDTLLIGLFLGTTALGYYTVALRLMTIVRSLTAGVGQAVALSAFSSLQREAARFREAYLTSLELCALVAFPALTGLALLAPAILTVTMGERWIDSAPLLSILCVAGWFEATALFGVQVLTAAGRPGTRLGLDAAGAAVRLAGYGAFVGAGLQAVAGVYLAAAALFMLLPTIVACRLLELPLGRVPARLRAGVIGAACMAAVLVAAGDALPAPGREPLGLALLVALGALAYCAALALLFRARLGELLRVLPSRRARPGTGAGGR